MTFVTLIEGMKYFLNTEALIFLDERNSSLVIRKPFDRQNKQMKWVTRCRKKWDNDVTYVTYELMELYDWDKKSYVSSENIIKSEWKQKYPNSITYVEEAELEYGFIDIMFRPDRDVSYRFHKYRYPYNMKQKYFVCSSDVTNVEWWINPDLIAYVEKTNQKTFKIVHTPEGKILTVIKLKDDSQMFIIADSKAEIL